MGIETRIGRLNHANCSAFTKTPITELADGFLLQGFSDSRQNWKSNKCRDTQVIDRSIHFHNFSKKAFHLCPVVKGRNTSKTAS